VLVNVQEVIIAQVALQMQLQIFAQLPTIARLELLLIFPICARVELMEARLACQRPIALVYVKLVIIVLMGLLMLPHSFVLKAIIVQLELLSVIPILARLDYMAIQQD